MKNHQIYVGMKIVCIDEDYFRHLKVGQSYVILDIFKNVFIRVNTKNYYNINKFISLKELRIKKLERILK